MLELDDKASYSFLVFPIPSFSFFFFHFSTVHVNSGDMEVQKKQKLRASANWKKKKRLRASGYWKKKVARLWLLCCKKQLGAASSPPALQTL